MFAVIRHYHFSPQDSAQIDKMVREEFVPLIKKAKGFVRYGLEAGARRLGSRRIDQAYLQLLL